MVTSGYSSRNFFSLASLIHMDRVARLGILAVQKHVQARGMAINQSRLFKSFSPRRQIRVAQDNVHVLGVSRRRVVHPRNPCGHGIATGHCAWHFPLLQGIGCAKQSPSDFFSGFAHALP
jgi:hypothetical protein